MTIEHIILKASIISARHFDYLIISIALKENLFQQGEQEDVRYLLGRQDNTLTRRDLRQTRHVFALFLTQRKISPQHSFVSLFYKLLYYSPRLFIPLASIGLFSCFQFFSTMSQMSDYDDDDYDDDDLPLPPIRKRNERALFSKVCVTIRIAICFLIINLEQGGVSQRPRASNAVDDDDFPLPPTRKRKEAPLSEKVCVTIRITMNSYMFPDY